MDERSPAIFHAGFIGGPVRESRGLQSMLVGFDSHRRPPLLQKLCFVQWFTFTRTVYVGK